MYEGNKIGIMLKFMYASMFVAGAYKVIAVAWVVVGMAIPTTLLGCV
jgi:hypothetical protein